MRGLIFRRRYGAAKRWLNPLILQLRKLTANEAVPSCVFALVLVYALSAEWLGSVAGITGAYLLGYVFAGSEFKADVERSFYALGHGLLIPLFFVSIGLSSDYRALSGHWMLMFAVLFVAIVGKLVGCGLAALGSGMDWVRSLRIGCGMMSRGEVGLIVTAMGATTGIFGRPEVAVMVAVVLLTTILTPVALRATFQLKSQQDIEEGLANPASNSFPTADRESPVADSSQPDEHSFKVMTVRAERALLAFKSNDAAPMTSTKRNG